jgi:hypothetical protein
MICKLQPAAQRHHDKPTASPTFGLIKEFQLVSKDFKRISKEIKANQSRKTMAPHPITAPVRSHSRHAHTAIAPVRGHSHLFAVDF